MVPFSGNDSFVSLSCNAKESTSALKDAILTYVRILRVKE